MLRPTPGELLAGVHHRLREQVLPHVPSGEPTRALRAALHLLERLERSWDLMPAYLTADNADLRRSLAELADRTGVPPRERPPVGHPDVPGVNDPAVRDLIGENARLQAELDQLQQHWRATGDGHPEVEALLIALHTRMAERAVRAAGQS
ncbi:MAG TPA: hypothetical protein VGH89_08905 [Pseudonocardia sp.]